MKEMTIGEVAKEAKRWNTIEEFKTYSPRAYRTADRYGWLTQIYQAAGLIRQRELVKDFDDLVQAEWKAKLKALGVIQRQQAMDRRELRVLISKESAIKEKELEALANDLNDKNEEREAEYRSWWQAREREVNDRKSLEHRIERELKALIDIATLAKAKKALPELWKLAKESDLDWEFERQWRKLRKEFITSKAVLFTSYGDFKAAHPDLYREARRCGMLHKELDHLKWGMLIEDVITLCRGYRSMKAFSDDHPGHWNKLRHDRELFNRAFGHLSLEDRDRCFPWTTRQVIEAMELCDDLTTFSKRFVTAKKYADQHLSNHPTMLGMKARSKERAIEARARNRICPVIWLSECQEAVARCSTRSEFQQKESRYAAYAKKAGWYEMLIENFLPQTRQPCRVLWYKEILDLALEYPSFSEFRKDAYREYNYAQRAGWLPSLKAELLGVRNQPPVPDPKSKPKPVRKPKPRKPKLTEIELSILFNHLQVATKNFSTKTAFKKAHPEWWKIIQRHGWSAALFGHLNSSRKWDKESASLEAKRYTGRKKFLQGSPGAYHAARAAGWLDDICSHMSGKRGG